MTNLLKTALATAFAAACLAGSTVAFANDNSGSKDSGANSSMKHMQDSGTETDAGTTGSIKCDNSNANVNSGCDKPGHLKQEERLENN